MAQTLEFIEKPASEKLKYEAIVAVCNLPNSAEKLMLLQALADLLYSENHPMLRAKGTP